MKLFTPSTSVSAECLLRIFDAGQAQRVRLFYFGYRQSPRILCHIEIAEITAVSALKILGPRLTLDEFCNSVKTLASSGENPPSGPTKIAELSFPLSHKTS